MKEFLMLANCHIKDKSKSFIFFTFGIFVICKYQKYQNGFSQDLLLQYLIPYEQEKVGASDEFLREDQLLENKSLWAQTGYFY